MLKNTTFLWVACALLVSCASAAGAQVVPAAERPHFDFAFGSGASSWNPDYGTGRMLGVTVWTDFRPSLPAALYGLGVEAEARDVDWHRNNQPGNFREATIGGGPIYTLTRYRKVQPYVKFLADFAGMNFRVSDPYYTHDTRNAYVPGGGLEARTLPYLWVRLDYEYQIWQPLFSNTKRPTPQGFTLGMKWDFGNFRSH
jgi:hypothetical protein